MVKNNTSQINAQKSVIKGTVKLVESGLIARTWGNISAKADENSFVITPSGKAYNNLKPEQIVAVNISNLAWSHDLKPSSEKGIHACVYKSRPDVNFVIHTHQLNASALSGLSGSIEVHDKKLAKLIGEKIPIARYALPGTKSLMKNVDKVLHEFSSNALIMGHHGAVCFGKDEAQAFLVAQQTEKACAEYLFETCSKKYSQKITTWNNLYELFLKQYSQKYLQEKKETKKELSLAQADDSLHKAKTKNLSFYDSTCDGETIVLIDQKTGKKIKSFLLSPPKEKENKGEKISPKEKKTKQKNETQEPRELAWHRAVYLADKNIRAIHHSHTPDALTLSKTNIVLRPLLDDFAQIVGISAKTISQDDIKNQKKVLAALKNRNGFFISHAGAFTYASSMSDATAAAMVLQKNSRAFIASFLLGKVKFIVLWEALLMRVVYLKKYSKLMENGKEK